MTAGVSVDYAITVNDWGKVLEFTLKDATGAKVDLSSCTLLQIRCAKTTRTSPLFVGTCTKNPDQVNHKGEGSYTFAASDAGTAGYYRAQIVATFPDQRLTFPTEAMMFEIGEELQTA